MGSLHGDMAFWHEDNHLENFLWYEAKLESNLVCTTGTSAPSDNSRGTKLTEREDFIMDRALIEHSETSPRQAARGTAAKQNL